MLHTSDNKAAFDLLQDHSPERDGERLSIAFQDLNQVAHINRLLNNHDLDVYLLHPKENDLEQLFIHLTTTQS